MPGQRKCYAPVNGPDLTTNGVEHAKRLLCSSHQYSSSTPRPDRPGRPDSKLTVTLIAIDALGKRPPCCYSMTSTCPRPAPRPAPPGQHTVYLDELSRTHVTAGSANGAAAGPSPSTPTCWSTSKPPLTTPDPQIALTVMDAIFHKLGLSPSRLRQDRILDEAGHTADPVHLMRVFGLTAKPAMRYVQAAHPERHSK